ncbi:hypothetical protein BpHYR1_006915 [Brachionus plicatilis]|uniref:Uncharacterized protein n=1 Tax=Brachionus plicatilis TaxID=10195 RepID=A0A3M7QS24_BRAPC|nr:hypothetical protein BpHYR1_006915 [Brachionus plicatilis]
MLAMESLSGDDPLLLVSDGELLVELGDKYAAAFKYGFWPELSKELNQGGINMLVVAGCMKL